MSESEVLYDRQGAVGTITLNRPKRGNALSAPMVDKFIAILNSAIADPAVRVIVVTGNGKYFCTGMDLTPRDDAPTGLDPVAVTQTMFTTLTRCPKPTVARVNGPALGGGVGILFACNIRVFHTEAYISMPEVYRGLIPALISEVIVPQLGVFRSKQYMLTGERVTAQEGYRVGFVTAVVNDTETLDNKVKEYVDLLLQGGPSAMQDVKQLVDAVDLRGGDQKAVASYVRTAFGKMITSEEAAHGIGAFATKQKPNWDDFGIGAEQLKSKL